MTDRERALVALRKVGARGLTVRDFDPGPGGQVIDGGGAFTRLHARICELREDGYQITTVRDKPFSRYVLTGFPPVVPVVQRLGGGWIRAHFCRRCDFYYDRPCAATCPTCEQPARLVDMLDARPARSERRAA